MSFHWTPDQSSVFVAEKAGFIYRLPSFTADKAAAVPVVDISAKTFTYGDHGLSSLLVDVNGAWLYATYMIINPANPDQKYTCTDYGQIDDRPLNEVEGCTTWGMFSRWPINAAGEVTGAEEVIINGQDIVEDTYVMCAQFSSHPITSIAQNPETRALFVGAADGASFTIADEGQLGDNPCKDRAEYPGAFRVQDPVRLNGKVGTVDPDTLAWRVYSTGHRNPWRISWDATTMQLLESESGWFSYEEINIIEDGKNYGWPCFEGPEATPKYSTTATAARLCPGVDYVRPQFAYAHPFPPPPGDVLSISAVAGSNGYVYYGEYVQKRLDSVSGWVTDTVAVQNVAPIELRVLPSGTVAFVDYDRNIIQSVSQGMVVTNPVFGPNPGQGSAARIVPSQVGWQAGSGQPLEFTGDSTAEGREGFIYTWRALLTSCAGCTNTTIVDTFEGQTFEFVSPAQPGTLIVEMTVSTLAGLSSQSAPYVEPATGTTICPCLRTLAGAAEDDSSGLSGGAIAGIAIGATAAVAIVAAVALFLIHRSRTRHDNASPVGQAAPGAPETLAARRLGNGGGVPPLDNVAGAAQQRNDMSTAPHTAAPTVPTPVGAERL
jgi:hypothetical protein